MSCIKFIAAFGFLWFPISDTGYKTRIEADLGNKMSIFGCIVSGRLVQTDFQQIGETQFVITIPEADNINHIVIFLTGVQPLPVGLAGLVYFSWPNPNAPPQWQMLGHISNDKPSAIFKISNLKKKPMDDVTSIFMFDQQMSHNAQVGISVEPAFNVKDPIPTNNVSTVVEISQKVLMHFLNYVTSFALSPSQILPNSNEMLVPLSRIQTWYSNVERRLMQNPDFWRS
ncbi:protein OPI10 homolog [Ischnura elegans]|uniref:protein OPI10 homolog n=1 Tax=Ischnura elegans TaxID=197161 RepID=UPI001ED88906|nr:protein OPI10 homolog [Ischnura elegans]